MARREDREAQGAVLRAVLHAGDEGLTDAEVTERCGPLDPAKVESAIESLLASGLLERREARLHPGGPARRFHHLRPL
jgi:predicted transcriptional regulator